MNQSIRNPNPSLEEVSKNNLLQSKNYFTVNSNTNLGLGPSPSMSRAGTGHASACLGLGLNPNLLRSSPL
jgi:hypothetical protein